MNLTPEERAAIVQDVLAAINAPKPAHLVIEAIVSGDRPDEVSVNQAVLDVIGDEPTEANTMFSVGPTNEAQTEWAVRYFLVPNDLAKVEGKLRGRGHNRGFQAFLEDTAKARRKPKEDRQDQPEVKEK